MRKSVGRRGLVNDTDFDALVPLELRHLSNLHWTPANVAVRAAQLLAPEPDARVLDIGAGIGKLCIVGALATRARWAGVEHQAVLVAAAERLARSFDDKEHTTNQHSNTNTHAKNANNALYFY